MDVKKDCTRSTFCSFFLKLNVFLNVKNRHWSRIQYVWSRSEIIVNRVILDYLLFVEEGNGLQSFLNVGDD